MSNLSDTYGYIDKCMPADSIFSNLTLVGHFALQYASKASNAGDMSKRNNEQSSAARVQKETRCSKQERRMRPACEAVTTFPLSSTLDFPAVCLRLHLCVIPLICAGTGHYETQSTSHGNIDGG